VPVGSVENGDLRLNRLGEIVAACWAEIPSHNRGARLDEFVVMPNHVHGVVLLDQAEDGQSPVHALSQVIGGFKSASAGRINQVRGTAGAPVWQRGYYERIVRGERALDNIRRYIVSNPALWDADEDNPARIGRSDL
jgi:REP element-mobilizing transposase RayT